MVTEARETAGLIGSDKVEGTVLTPMASILVPSSAL